MEISFIVKQQSISVVIRSEQWKKFMWNTVESVLKSANPPNISWVHIHGSVKSSDLQQIMERTKQHSTRACPNTQEPVSQDWSQLYICIYRRRGIVRLLAETNLSERYNHDKTENWESAGCNVRSVVRQLDSFYTADHLTLTKTQMMAGERNDSQTGHALAQGPLATDIMAASSATLWISSTVCRAVEDQKPGPNRPRWNAFQTTVLTSDPVPEGGGMKDAERLMTCGWDLTCTAASSRWRCCCWGSSGTAGASCLQPGRSAQACSLPTPLAAAFRCLAGREPPLTQRKNINVLFFMERLEVM